MSDERDPGFEYRVESAAELRQHYRQPNDIVLAKTTTALDDGSRDFVARSTFVLIATSDADGRLDVSPRGGPAGFVKVLDEHRLVVPDLNGNNLLDSLGNIVEHGRVGMLFVIPGLGETLRVNGRACVTIDPGILDSFTDELRRPTSAIGVTVEQAFVHCAKALRRGALWRPEEWPTPDSRPSAGQLLVDHVGLGDTMTGAQLDEMLEASYAADLAADRPV